MSASLRPLEHPLPSDILKGNVDLINKNLTPHTMRWMSATVLITVSYREALPRLLAMRSGRLEE